MKQPPADLYPESGARLLLELDAQDAESATYRLTALMPGPETDRGRGVVRFGTEQVELEGLAASPEWVRTLGQRLLRQVAAGQRGEASPRWPRRILRWRAK